MKGVVLFENRRNKMSVKRDRMVKLPPILDRGIFHLYANLERTSSNSSGVILTSRP